MVKEIDKEAKFVPAPPKQPYIEVRSKASHNSRGSITKSRSKAQWEKTYESKEEEAEPQIKKGKKPNRRLRDMEAAQEKAARKQTSLDQHIRVITSGKQPQGIIEEKKDKTIPPAPKK